MHAPLHLLMAAAVALPIAMVAEHAHAIFKCQAGGQTVYQDKPCASGSQTEIEVPGSRDGTRPDAPNVRYTAPPTRPAAANTRAPEKARGENARTEIAQTWKAASKSAQSATPELVGAKLSEFIDAATRRERTKGEFESTAEFEQRIAALRITRTFVTETQSTSSKALSYDADRRVMMIDFSTITNGDVIQKAFGTPNYVTDRPVIWYNEATPKSDVYTGENAFGAKRAVVRKTVMHWGGIPQNPPEKLASVIEEQMAPPQARELKANARWRIKGTVRGETSYKWFDTTRPTLDDLRDEFHTYRVSFVTMDRLELVDSKGTVIAAVEFPR